MPRGVVGVRVPVRESTKRKLSRRRKPETVQREEKPHRISIKQIREQAK